MSADWQPVCDLAHLRARAQMLTQIRLFFQQHRVLEVETPLLCSATGTDPQLDFFATCLHSAPQNPALYLQTSPEFAMKRLLAAGSGSIFQICKAFRNGESGRYHNPEFSILEWYRLGFNMQQLIDECIDLLQNLLLPIYPQLRVLRISYRDLLLQSTGLDLLQLQLPACRQYAETQGLNEAAALCGNQLSLWLDFLFSHCVQPAMQPECIYAVYHYPAMQSSLARLLAEDTRLAQRFELFFNGLELGNGFCELTDAVEQEARFDKEIAYRKQAGLASVVKDQRFLAALSAGLPDCSGVALGLDRLLMLICQVARIDDVLAFPLHKV